MTKFKGFLPATYSSGKFYLYEKAFHSRIECLRDKFVVFNKADFRQDYCYDYFKPILVENKFKIWEKSIKDVENGTIQYASDSQIFRIWRNGLPNSTIEFIIISGFHLMSSLCLQLHSGSEFIKKKQLGEFLIFKMIGYSSKQDNIQHFFYKNNDGTLQDQKFKQLTHQILSSSDLKPNRTGINTKSLFAQTLTFDVRQYRLPLTTLRRIPFRFIINELLWMIQGHTDSKLLEKKNINIWKGNTSKEFIEQRGLSLPEGELGPGYGFQFRHFGGNYTTRSKGGIDQIHYIDEALKKRDFSRRLVISLWNPRDIDKAVLPPCHFTFMLNHTQKDGIDYLDGSLIMRSSDELARSWNCSFYTILLFIYCKRHNYQPRYFSIFMNDAHVYENHIPAVETYLKRENRPFPMIELNIDNKSFDDLQESDFKLVGYFPHPGVKMDMAV